MAATITDLVKHATQAAQAHKQATEAAQATAAQIAAQRPAPAALGSSETKAEAPRQ